MGAAKEQTKQIAVVGPGTDVINKHWIKGRRMFLCLMADKENWIGAISLISRWR